MEDLFMLIIATCVLSLIPTALVLAVWCGLALLGLRVPFPTNHQVIGVALVVAAATAVYGIVQIIIIDGKRWR